MVDVTTKYTSHQGWETKVKITGLLDTILLTIILSKQIIHTGKCRKKRSSPAGFKTVV